MMRHKEPPRHIFRQPNVIGTSVKATLKWFDPERGFGFVRPDEGGADALLPMAVVAAAGHQRLPEGASVVVDIVEGRKGNQVSLLHCVDTSTAQERPTRFSPRSFGENPAGGGRPAAAPFARGPASRDSGPRPAFVRGPPVGMPPEIDGTVKWYNSVKGFGFIEPDGGGRDIFVHAKALERSNLSGLDEAQRVHMTLRQGEKGVEAHILTPLPAVAPKEGA